MTEFLRYKAGIFDADGTVINSSTVNNEAFGYVYQELTGKPFDIKMVTSTVGGSIQERFKKLLPKMIQENKSLINKLYHQDDVRFVNDCTKMHRLYQADNIDRINLFTGIDESLELLKDLGVKLAIVTNRTSSGMFILEELGLTKLFDEIIVGDDVKRMKPYPDGINLALQKLNVSPTESAMIGDTWRDIVAGKKASVTTVAAVWGDDNWDLIRSRPDLYVTKITDLNRVFIRNVGIDQILKSIRTVDDRVELFV